MGLENTPRGILLGHNLPGQSLWLVRADGCMAGPGGGLGVLIGGGGYLPFGASLQGGSLMTTSPEPKGSPPSHLSCCSPLTDLHRNCPVTQPPSPHVQIFPVLLPNHPFLMFRSFLWEVKFQGTNAFSLKLARGLSGPLMPLPFVQAIIRGVNPYFLAKLGLTLSIHCDH
jgi:hypothetical protein